MSVCLSVGHNLESCRTDLPIEPTFGVWTTVGPGNPVLDRGRADPFTGRANGTDLPSGRGIWGGLAWTFPGVPAADILIVIRKRQRVRCGISLRVLWQRVSAA